MQDGKAAYVVIPFDEYVRMFPKTARVPEGDAIPHEVVGLTIKKGYPLGRAWRVVAYGFIFLHPFEDGNGRIHRFLICNILARSGFTPEGVMFPISASMLKNPAGYNTSLEAFSRHLLALVEYSIDEEGCLTVHNDTAGWYRYIDMTPQAEALFGFIERTINAELARELAFLAHYDKAKRTIQEIVDMPDRKIALFICFCLQNNGRLSAQKRLDHFDFLSDEETARMEQAVQTAYGSKTSDDE